MYQTQNLLSVINLGNSIIGVSVLAMPFCFKQCGIILGVLLLLFSTWLTLVSCQLLVKAGVASRRRSYEFLAYHLFGAAGKFIVEVGMIGLQIGTLIAQIVVIGDLGPAIVSKVFELENTPNLRMTIIICLCLFIGLPLGLLKDLHKVSRASTICMCFYAVFIVYILGLSGSNLWSGSWYPKVEFWNPAGVFRTLPIFALSFGCQTQLFLLYDALPEPSLKTINSIISSAVNFCAVAYLLVGFFGYIAFYQEEITGDIITQFPATFTADIMKLCFVFSIVITFPVIIFPCRSSLYTLLFPQKPKSHEDLQHDSRIPEIHFKVITVAIICGSMVVGILVPNVEFILGMNGATVGTLICYIFPALFFIRVMTAKTEGRNVAKLVMVFGVSILVVSTFTTLYSQDKGHTHAVVPKVVEGEDLLKQGVPPPIDLKNSETNYEKRIEPPIPKPPDDSLEKKLKSGKVLKEKKDIKKDILDKLKDTDEKNDNQNDKKVNAVDNEKGKEDVDKGNVMKEKIDNVDGLHEEKHKDVVKREEKLEEKEAKNQKLLEDLVKQQKEVIKEQKELLKQLKDHKDKEHGNEVQQQVLPLNQGQPNIIQGQAGQKVLRQGQAGQQQGLFQGRVQQQGLPLGQAQQQAMQQGQAQQQAMPQGQAQQQAMPQGQAQQQAMPQGQAQQQGMLQGQAQQQAMAQGQAQQQVMPQGQAQKQAMAQGQAQQQAAVQGQAQQQAVVQGQAQQQAVVQGQAQQQAVVQGQAQQQAVAQGRAQQQAVAQGQAQQQAVAQGQAQQQAVVQGQAQQQAVAQGQAQQQAVVQGQAQQQAMVQGQAQQQAVVQGQAQQQAVAQGQAQQQAVVQGQAQQQAVAQGQAQQQAVVQGQAQQQAVAQGQAQQQAMPVYDQNVGVGNDKQPQAQHVGKVAQQPAAGQVNQDLGEQEQDAHLAPAADVGVRREKRDIDDPLTNLDLKVDGKNIQDDANNKLLSEQKRNTVLNDKNSEHLTDKTLPIHDEKAGDEKTQSEKQNEKNVKYSDKQKSEMKRKLKSVKNMNELPSDNLKDQSHLGKRIISDDASHRLAAFQMSRRR